MDLNNNGSLRAPIFVAAALVFSFGLACSSPAPSNSHNDSNDGEGGAHGSGGSGGSACSPSEERCNSLDDDCNGSIDDVAPVTCSLRGCSFERSGCTDGSPTICDDEFVERTHCGDGIDNDCDERIDCEDLDCVDPDRLTESSSRWVRVEKGATVYSSLVIDTEGPSAGDLTLIVSNRGGILRKETLIDADPTAERVYSAQIVRIPVGFLVLATVLRAGSFMGVDWFWLDEDGMVTNQSFGTNPGRGLMDAVAGPGEDEVTLVIVEATQSGFEYKIMTSTLDGGTRSISGGVTPEGSLVMARIFEGVPVFFHDRYPDLGLSGQIVMTRLQPDGSLQSVELPLRFDRNRLFSVSRGNTGKLLLAYASAFDAPDPGQLIAGTIDSGDNFREVGQPFEGTASPAGAFLGTQKGVVVAQLGDSNLWSVEYDMDTGHPESPKRMKAGTTAGWLEASGQGSFFIYTNIDTEVHGVYQFDSSACPGN